MHLEADLHQAIAWAGQHGRRWAIAKSNAGARYCQFFDNVGDLSQIDWAAVAAHDWTPAEVKEGKQAEFLMHNSFSWTLIGRVGVQSRAAYAQVADVLKHATHQPKIEIRPDWYY